MRQWKSMLLPFACIGGVILAIIYVCYSLGSWYIDDSAISLTYARNLTRGIGLISQVGDKPVEGFSNPLWVFLEALMMKLFQWESLLIPRVLSCALLLILVCHIFLRYRNNPLKLFVWQFAVLLTILQPAVSIWSMSGLENGLLVFLTFELLMHLMDNGGGNPWMISLLVAAMSLTRPDAILFAATYPLCILFSKQRFDLDFFKKLFKSLLIVLLCYGGYLIFRMIYFGELMPNTYYAKALPTVISMKEVLLIGPEMRARVISAFFALFGYATPWILVGVCVCVWSNRSLIFSWMKEHLPMLIVLFIAVFAYAYLPNDWMPCYRFATAAFVASYVILAHGCFSLVSGFSRYVCMCILLVCGIMNFIMGVRQFVKEKPIGVADVQERGAYFERWGNYLGINKPLVMTADAGGILWDERVCLLDLGMLCDSVVAHSLGEYTATRDHKKFIEYVFERKPDFIATRAYHSYLASLDIDLRFRSYYVPIHEYIDLWILNRYGMIIMSGDYVRKDLLESHKGVLEKMRKESQGIFYPFDNKNLRLNIEKCNNGT